MTHATQQYTPIQWVGLLYHRSHAPTGWIEFRFLPDRTRFWMPHPTFEGQKGELTLSKLPQGQNAYWGISIRREKGKGGATDVHPTHLVWADIDLKGTHYLGGDLNPQEWEAEELREAAQLCMADTLNTCATHGLNPRAVVYTGHGLQIYFARTVRTTTEDTERFNTALAALLHGDEKTVDVARIFRLPGSQNLKNPSRPLPVEVWHADPEATTPEDRLLALLPAKTPAPKPTPLPTTSTPHEGSVIEAWNQRYSIHDMLQRYGYRKETPDRYTRPGEGASGHDVAILKNSRGVPCSFHHSSNDPVANSPLDGHLCEPFDLYAHYEHADDWKAATRAAANHLGMKPPRKEGKLTATNKNGSDVAPDEDRSRKQTLAEYRDMFLDWCAEEDHIYKYHQTRKNWYQYHKGVYLDTLDEVMLQRADKAFQSMGYMDLRTGFLKEVLDKVAREYHIGAIQEDLKATELNVQNGILDLETLTLREHTPEYFSTIQSAATYNPDLVAYRWLEFLSDAIPSDTDRLILQMYAGLCLTGITSPQRALLLTGEGGTGKGTFVHVLETVLGQLATSSALENIKDGSFLIGNLVGRRMCVVSELSRHVDWLPFKRVTGEDKITVDVKNKTPYITKLDIKLIILSNIIPFLGEDATNTSLTRRFITIPFNQKPKTINPNLREKLTTPTELSGVLNWMLEGWRKLQERGLKFPEADNTIEAEMKEKSNHVITYVREQLSTGGTTTGAELYANYRQWAYDNGHHPYHNNTFSGERLPAALKENGIQAVKQRTKRGVTWEGIHIPL